MKTVIILTTTYVFLISLINGCSIIGFGIGSQIDDSDSNEILPSRYSISRLEAGCDIVIIFYDANMISGKFIESDSFRRIYIDNDNGIQSIPIDDIKLIKKDPSYAGRIIGGLAGLTLDIVL